MFYSIFIYFFHVFNILQAELPHSPRPHSLDAKQYTALRTRDFFRVSFQDHHTLPNNTCYLLLWIFFQMEHSNCLQRKRTGPSVTFVLSNRKTDVASARPSPSPSCHPISPITRSFIKVHPCSIIIVLVLNCPV